MKTLEEQVGYSFLSMYYNMIDNYIQQEYHSWDRIYLHPQTQNCLFLGDHNAAHNLNFIYSHSIATVVTAALGMDDLDYSQINVTHIVYPLLDSKTQNIAQFFEAFFNLIQKSIKNGNVLVHCSAGVSRSPTLLIAYLMKKQNWTFRQTIDYVRKSRPKVMPNLGFEKQLKSFEAQLKQLENPQSATRQMAVRTSANKRQVSVIKYEQLQNIGNFLFRKSPKTAPHRPNAPISRRDGFQIRAIKLKSMDVRKKESLKQPKADFTLDNIEPAQLNFSVLKIQINERMPKKLRVRPRIILNH